MNPCPCGYLGQARCHCTEEQVRRYRGKITGPLLDRIDMLMEVPAVDKKLLWPQPDGIPPQSSQVVRQRVIQAR